MCACNCPRADAKQSSTSSFVIWLTGMNEKKKERKKRNDSVASQMSGELICRISTAVRWIPGPLLHHRGEKSIIFRAQKMKHWEEWKTAAWRWLQLPLNHPKGYCLPGSGTVSLSQSLMWNTLMLCFGRDTTNARLPVLSFNENQGIKDLITC